MPGNLYRVDVVSLLDLEASAVLARWEASIEANSPPVVTHEELVEAFRERGVLSQMIKATRDDLKHEDLILFPYYLPHQKESLRRRLIRAHYLHAVQARIDEIECRWDGLKEDRTQCAHYEKLLNELQHPPVEKISDKTVQLERLSDDSSKPLRWFGMRILAPLFALSMVDLCAGKTAVIKGLFVEIDKKDTYMGWSRAFILSILRLVPDGFSYTSTTAKFQSIAPMMSYLNIIVVNMCLGIELFLVMKNTFAGAWATRHHDVKVPMWEQFTTQLRQRQFVLLNWLCLSIMHVAAFLCMTGVLNIWPWGPFFAVGCRITQLLLTSARYEADLVSYRANALRVSHQIKQLIDENLANMEAEVVCEDVEQREKLQMKIKVVQLEIDSLRRAANKVETDWQLKNLEFRRQAIFTSWFFVGVLLFSCLIFPPATIIPVIALALGLAGATICFTSLLVISKVRADAGMDRTRSEMLSMHLKKSDKQTAVDEQMNGYLARFMQLKSQPQDMQVTMEMKQLYLMMSQLLSRSQRHAQMLERQKIELWLTLARDILIPIVVLSMFIFIPTGVGLGVIAGILIINLFVKQVIDTYIPMTQQVVTFNDNAYQQFVDEPLPKNLLSEEKNYADQNRFYQQSLVKKSGDNNAEDDFTSSLNFVP